MRLRILAALMIAPLAVAADTAVPPQLYELRTEIVMPHLEESLRYAVTREQQCLSASEVLTAFAILRHPALAGCRLEPDGRSMSYALVCDAATGTTGRAIWSRAGRLLRGILRVKLGGKNMTFEQRITARALGACEASGFDRKTRGAPYADDH